MKKLFFLTAVIAALGCQQPNHQKSTLSAKTGANPNRYTMTIYAYDFTDPKNSAEIKPFVDTLYEVNDTIGYLSAVKKWYYKKIDEKAGTFHGLLKSYTVVDKNGVELSVKLGPNVLAGINKQIEQMPDIRNYIEQAQRDSLP